MAVQARESVAGAANDGALRAAVVERWIAAGAPAAERGPLLLTLAAIAVYALIQRVPFTVLLLYPAAILLSTVLLAVLHRFARRFTPDLAHVLADAAVGIPMALILVAR